MAKRKTKKRRKHSGSGSYCVTSARPRTKGGKGRGGITFSTVCYGSQDKALDALKRRTKGSYNVMIHRRGKGR